MLIHLLFSLCRQRWIINSANRLKKKQKFIIRLLDNTTKMSILLIESHSAINLQIKFQVLLQNV